MSYVPNAPAIFISAYNGALAGMGVSAVNANTDPNQYLPLANAAGIWAEAVDTVWGAVRPVSNLDIVAIEDASLSTWYGRATPPPSGSIAGYTNEATAIVAAITAAENFFTAQGINPNIPSTVVLTGDVTGPVASNTVGKIQNVPVPVPSASGAGRRFLTESNVGNTLAWEPTAYGNNGNVLQINVAGNVVWNPVNLAGGANFVTGLLPAGNQSPQVMGGDVTGNTAVNTVNQATGNVAGIFPVTSPIGLGAGTLAGTGSIRAANNNTILAARNAGNTADISIIKTDGANNLTMGDLANVVTYDLFASAQFLISTPGFELRLTQATGVLNTNASKVVPEGDNVSLLGQVGGLSWATCATYKTEFTNRADPASPSVGGVLYASAGNLRGIDTLGTLFDVTPQPTGAINTQVAQQTAFIKYGRVTASGQTVAQVVALPTNTTNLQIQVASLVKVVVAGAGTAVGDTFSDIRKATFKNVAGVVTQVGAAVSTGTDSDASLNTSAVTFVIAGTNITVTLTVNNAGGLGTADCSLSLENLFN
jgi:hypothetical protein